MDNAILKIVVCSKYLINLTLSGPTISLLLTYSNLNKKSNVLICMYFKSLNDKIIMLKKKNIA